MRSATREQVKSLGAKFVETGVSADGAGGYARELTAEEKAKQQEALDARIAAADAVISTASVPGRKAPRHHLEGRRRAHARRLGDRRHRRRTGRQLRAHQGRRDRDPPTASRSSARSTWPAPLAYNASEMYARNLLNFLKPAIDKAGELKIDWADEVFAGAVLTHDGAIKHEATRKAVEG